MVITKRYGLTCDARDSQQKADLHTGKCSNDCGESNSSKRSLGVIDPDVLFNQRAAHLDFSEQL